MKKVRGNEKQTLSKKKKRSMRRLTSYEAQITEHLTKKKKGSWQKKKKRVPVDYRPTVTFLAIPQRSTSDVQRSSASKLAFLRFSHIERNNDERVRLCIPLSFVFFFKSETATKANSRQKKKEQERIEKKKSTLEIRGTPTNNKAVKT